MVLLSVTTLYWVILTQGIIPRIVVLPETDVMPDLNYKPADKAKLFRKV